MTSRVIRPPQALRQGFGNLPTRPFTSSLSARSQSASQDDQKRMGSNPQANQPDSPLSKSVRKDTPNTDRQSATSQDEHKSGDDHPAKQPDPQPQPQRTTGIGGEEGVKGGKQGLSERGDR